MIQQGASADVLAVGMISDGTGGFHLGFWESTCALIKWSLLMVFWDGVLIVWSGDLPGDMDASVLSFFFLILFNC